MGAFPAEPPRAVPAEQPGGRIHPEHLVDEAHGCIGQGPGRTTAGSVNPRRRPLPGCEARARKTVPTVFRAATRSVPAMTAKCRSPGRGVPPAVRGDRGERTAQADRHATGPPEQRVFHPKWVTTGVELGRRVTPIRRHPLVPPSTRRRIGDPPIRRPARCPPAASQTPEVGHCPPRIPRARHHRWWTNRP